MKYKQIVAIGLCAIVLAVIFLSSYFRQVRMEDIKKTMQLTEGTIVEIDDTRFKGQSTMHIYYRYYVNGEVKEGRASSKIEIGGKLTRVYLLYRKFPVVYSSKDPDESDMLILHEDSVKYGLVAY